MPAQCLPDDQPDSRVAFRVGTELAEALDDRKKLSSPACILVVGWFPVIQAARTPDGLLDRLCGPDGGGDI